MKFKLYSSLIGQVLFLGEVLFISECEAASGKFNPYDEAGLPPEEIDVFDCPADGSKKCNPYKEVEYACARMTLDSEKLSGEAIKCIPAAACGASIYSGGKRVEFNCDGALKNSIISTTLIAMCTLYLAM